MPADHCGHRLTAGAARLPITGFVPGAAGPNTAPPPKLGTYLLGERKKEQQGAGRAGHGAQRLLFETQHVHEAPARAHPEAGQHLRSAESEWRGRSLLPAPPRLRPRDTAQRGAAIAAQPRARPRAAPQLRPPPSRSAEDEGRGNGRAAAGTHFVQHLEDNEGEKGESARPAHRGPPRPAPRSPRG